ncbi:MAG: GGDEF domain-containing protein [Patulibacter sp.]|nr:GGDEF domain-containing protein [Patulibacter sp.]
MASPHIRPVVPPSDSADPNTAPEHGSVGVVEGQSTILGRRDVAIVPWVTIAMCAVAVAFSTALRPAGSVSHTLVIGGALAYAAFAGGLSLLQDLPTMVRLRRSLPIYLFGSTMLVGLLALVAALDQGVSTVFFAPIVQVAMYLGLVLPRRWSRGTIVLLLLTVGAVHAINPAGSDRDLMTMTGLVVAGWLVGVLCHSTHGSAARIALLLSRSDVLTATLNRRGFFEQFDAEIAASRVTGEPIALLIVDLDSFKAVNDDLGHAAGDELLSWVGHAIPTVLPERASMGRLGGDEFGVILPGLRRTAADAVAATIAEVLASRIGVSIGVATSEDPETTADDYLRVADAALYACKDDPDARVHSLVAGSTRRTAAEAKRHHQSRPPALTYAQRRAAGGPPDRPASGIHFGWLLRGGFWVVAVSGAVVVASFAIGGTTNAWGRAILWVGIPWVLANLVLGWFTFGTAEELRSRLLLTRFSSTMLVGLGISIAMLADGGITTPIVAGLYLKVLFDATVLSKRDALETAGLTVAWWVFAALLSPTDQLWAVPYQLTLFAVSFGLGIVGRRAFTDATSARLRLAHTDPLTGLRNRPGFEQGAERAFGIALEEGRPFAIVAFDLDDFKAVNDTHGHAAGDELLQQVAAITKETLPSAYSIGRLGGDEFIAAVPAGSIEEAGALATALTARLRTIVGASVGCAVHPADGLDLEGLMRSADHRSYSAKPGRTRHSPLTVAADETGSGTAAA